MDFFSRQNLECKSIDIYILTQLLWRERFGAPSLSLSTCLYLLTSSPLPQLLPRQTRTVLFSMPSGSVMNCSICYQLECFQLQVTESPVQPIQQQGQFRALYTSSSRHRGIPASLIQWLSDIIKDQVLCLFSSAFLDMMTLCSDL